MRPDLPFHWLRNGHVTCIEIPDVDVSSKQDFAMESLFLAFTYRPVEIKYEVPHSQSLLGQD